MAQEALDILLQTYPILDREVLENLLTANNGSLSETKRVINDSVFKTCKKRKTGPQYQASITSLIGGGNDKKRKRASLAKNGVIQLHNPEDVQQYLDPYVSFYKSFLPAELSNKVLQDFMDQKDTFEAKKFYILDNLCVSNHKLKFFCDKNSLDFLTRVIYNGKENCVTYYNDILKEVASFVEGFMNQNMIKPSNLLEYLSKEPWHGNACIVNYFENSSNNLDWHSDRMTYIGPHNFIVSISLGATREFRLRKKFVDESCGNPIYSLLVPHNSVVIMRPGCQELFKHSVNAMRAPVQLNPISGRSRFNITFRFYRKLFANSQPSCHCNLPMTLRTSFKKDETRGKYFWSCENKYQNKDCGCFSWANFHKPEENYVAESEEEASVGIKSISEEINKL